MRAPPVACAVLLMAAALCVTACGVGTPAPAATKTVLQPASAPTPSPAPTATVAGKCVTGYEDVTAGWFDTLVDTAPPTSNPSELFAEAYQLTLTDTSSVTAEVTGFSVVFTSAVNGEEGSNTQTLSQPSFITPGSSLTWTESPWGTYSEGQASLGPYAAGVAGAFDSSSTCQLVQWN
jgi:hypothetical protein